MLSEGWYNEVLRRCGDTLRVSLESLNLLPVQVEPIERTRGQVINICQGIVTIGKNRPGPVITGDNDKALIGVDDIISGLTRINPTGLSMGPQLPRHR